IAGAVDAFAIAERLEHRLAQDDAHVFDGVVLVDVEIAGGPPLQVEAAVSREQLQHVIEEADTGPHIVAAAAIDGERTCDLRFRGLAVEPGAGRLLHRMLPPDITDSSASIARSVCVSSPAVTRMQPGVAGSFDRSRTWTP